MKTAETTNGKRTRSGWLLGSLGLLLSLGTLTASAQVSNILAGAPMADSCGLVYFTNTFRNNGPTLNNLFITNVLPSANWAYVPGLSEVTLPSGVVLNGAAADPTVNGQDLVWDFSSVVTPSDVDHLLITEVFYNYTGPGTKEDHEWFEIYNPTPNPVTLNGWQVGDANPGQLDLLPTFTIAPGEFVIIAGRTNAFLADHPAYTGQVYEVADGKIGSGLNVVPGDGVFLISTMGPVDSVSYGGSTAAFNPAVPGVGAGHSLERSPANNDTNRRNDWRDQPTPNPGSGNLPQGLSSGAEITIVYAVEINCAAVSGQLFARAGFEQPIGTATNATGSAFLTVNIPDLVVTKTPIMQEAGEGDEVVWTVRIANEGFGTAQNVVASDRLGPGLAFTGFDPTPANATVSNAVWDSTVIPALASLAPGAYVDIVVTAQVVACKGLFNQADAKWGCQNLQVLANEICEDTSLENETATAGIRFLDRFPSISYAMDPSPILVDYCAGTEVTLYITNASGAEVGTAYNMTGTPVMPPGWSLTGDNVISNVLHFDPLPAGTATSVTFRVNAGGCPISTNEFYLYFRPYYEDACGTPFTGPIGVSLARVINPPSASVTKIMPTSVSGDDGSIPVTVRLSYTNFTGSETITVTDVFPAHTNLTAPQNITGGGTLTSTSVVWTVSGLSGSGT